MDIFEEELTSITDLNNHDVPPIYELDFSPKERENLFIAWVCEKDPREVMELMEMTDEIFDRSMMAYKALVMSKGEVNSFRPIIQLMFENLPNKALQDRIDEVWEQWQTPEWQRKQNAMFPRTGL